MTHYRIVIIGGGAAGFFAAIHNKKAHPHAEVIILEQGKDILNKVKISGGGRCNVTHACFDPNTLSEFYPRGQKELRQAFHYFQPKDTIAWFESHGVPLKTESDNRVFPQSNQSESIVACLTQTAAALGVKTWTSCGVSTLTKEGETFTLSLSNTTTLQAQKVILATGSSRHGHTLAQHLGHTIIPPVPSLFTFKINDPALHALSGLSVQTADAWLIGEKKQKQTGPILITHWGFSGPCIIRLSAWKARELHDKNYISTLHINWLSTYTEEQLSQTLTRFQTQNPQKTLKTICPFSEIPQRLWTYLIQKASLSDTLLWKDLSQKHRQHLIQALLCGTFQITGKGTFKEEFVTCGGIQRSEIDFKTMESKHCPGFHVIGEALDIDGITGGFNFQNAWTTAYLSAKNRS